MFLRLWNRVGFCAGPQQFRFSRIMPKLEDLEVDTEAWMQNLRMLDEDVVPLYLQETLAIVQGKGSSETARSAIHYLIQIVADLSQETGDYEHATCQAFLTDLQTFSSVFDKMTYMTLYCKALCQDERG